MSVAEALLGRTLCAPCWHYPAWRSMTTRDGGVTFGAA